MSARISIGDCVETRSDGVQWIVRRCTTTDGIVVLHLERNGGEVMVTVQRTVRRIGRQVPLPGGAARAAGGGTGL